MDAGLFLLFNKSNFEQFEVSVDVQDWPAGSYFYSVSMANGVDGVVSQGNFVKE